LHWKVRADRIHRWASGYRVVRSSAGRPYSRAARAAGRIPDMDGSTRPEQLARLVDALEDDIVNLDELAVEPAGPEVDQDQSAVVPGSPEPPD
jgi:hypothetical protein